jgi:hypothetical protein
VKKGSGNPVGFSDQPWHVVAPSKKESDVSISEEKAAKGSKAPKQPTIYASYISKYVFKKNGSLSHQPSSSKLAISFHLFNPLAEKLRKPTLRHGRQWEKKREQGLRIAEAVAGLDQGLEFFSQEDEVVFAKY